MSAAPIDGSRVGIPAHRARCSWRACDAYVLMSIVHDFGDQQAEAVLAAVANAGRSSGATVLLVETVMPEGAEPHWAKILDVIMLGVTGGRERTITSPDQSHAEEKMMHAVCSRST